jgi:hypothetical protein
MNKQVWLTPRALKLHAVILVVVPGFMALCIWQLDRALGGNELSWAYVFEWPFFAAYAVYMWWRFVHEAPDVAASATAAVSSGESDAPGTPQLTPEPEQGATHDVTTGAPDGREAHASKSDEEDAELAAYNEYLAQLAARDKAAGR